MRSYEFPYPETEQQTVVSRFGGIDCRTHPTKVSLSRSPDMQNMICDQNDFLVKRTGWRTQAQFNAPIYGLFAMPDGVGCAVHAGAKLYFRTQDGTQTELCAGMTNLYDLSNHADWKYGSMDDIKDCIQLGKSGSAQFTCDGTRNYLVAMPTAFPDWSLVGIIQADEVDGALYDVQNSSLILLGALCFFTVIIVVLALGMESRLRLKNEEMERLNLEREKMKSDRFLQSMSRIVDRYSIVNLDTGRYRYYELRFDQPLYPTSGQYSEMVEIISKRYVALIDTENAKLSRLLTPDYLRSVLRKPDDNLKIEYCSRTENAYMVDDRPPG